MIVERFFTPELAQVAYAVGDREAGEVALIDPRRDVGEYVDWAKRHNLRITAVLETHVHADYVSGAPALSEVTGAPVYASRLGDQEFDHIPVDDGMELGIGRVRLTALHTPGHTPEHMAWMAQDTAEPDATPILFSGDSLFVGDVGRPDLLGESQTDGLVNKLYQTVTTVFEKLPPETVVYPGHTAGSSCGKKLGDDPNTTIGRERRENYAFQTGSAQEFKEAVMDGMPQSPSYYPVLKRVNIVGAEPITSAPIGKELDADAVARLQADGALIIDARERDAYASGHIPGSVFAKVGPSMSTWMGWIAPYDRDLLLIVDDRESYEEARLMLGRIGLDRVAGYMVGLNSWIDSGRDVETTRVVSVADLHEALGKPDQPLVLDVRSESEFEEDHIREGTHYFLGRIAQGDMPNLTRDDDIVIVCGAGYRSLVAASLMKSAGFTNLSSLDGGMEAWNEIVSAVHR